MSRPKRPLPDDIATLEQMRRDLDTWMSDCERHNFAVFTSLQSIADVFTIPDQDQFLDANVQAGKEMKQRLISLRLEFAKTRTIRQYINDDGPDPSQEQINIFKQILELCSGSDDLTKAETESDIHALHQRSYQCRLELHPEILRRIDEYDEVCQRELGCLQDLFDRIQRKLDKGTKGTSFQEGIDRRDTRLRQIREKLSNNLRTPAEILSKAKEDAELKKILEKYGVKLSRNIIYDLFYRRKPKKKNQ